MISRNIREVSQLKTSTFDSSQLQSTRSSSACARREVQPIDEDNDGSSEEWVSSFPFEEVPTILPEIEEHCDP